MIRKLWTHEQAAELRKLWQAGFSATIIAKKMNMSRNAVLGKKHRMELAIRIPRNSHPGKRKPK